MDDIMVHTIPDTASNEISQDHAPDVFPEVSQNHIFDPSLPVIPTEDSYFEDAPSRPQSLGIRDLGVILNSKRHATLHVAIRGAGTAWIDQDDSGTYDPEKERVTPEATPPPRRRAKKYDSDGNTVTPPPHRQRHPPVGYRSILTFSFKSERALSYLRSITPGPYEPRPTSLVEDASDSSDEEDENDGPPLKKGKARRTRNVRETLEKADGLTVDTLTIGHPQRRGCKACFEIGDDHCSLIEYGHEYPCIACDDASIDCEYIIAPELKRSCERCKQKRISCSYRIDDGEGVESCDACVEAETRCLAGPLKGSLRKADDACTTIAPPRKYVACNQCRSNNLRCNLKRDQPGPCSQCRKRGESCQFVLIRAPQPLLSLTPPQKKSKRGKKAGKQTRKASANRSHDSDVDNTPGRPGGRLENTLLAEAAHHQVFNKKPGTLLKERERRKLHQSKKKQEMEAKARAKDVSTKDVTPEFIPPLGVTSGISHIRIRTAFSHPIIFNHIPDPMETSPCSWCNSPLFGLYGYLEIEVEVIPFPTITGHGYEEMPGGHAEKGEARTQMCVACTFMRIGIMSCDKHVLQPIEVDPRLNIQKEVEKSAIALIEHDELGGSLVRNAKWCSICPTAAQFKCCARQTEDDVTGTDDGRGCGLHLCSTCLDLMTQVSSAGYRGEELLDRTIRHAANDRFNYENGVRADASFLTTTGELRVRLDKSFGEEGGDANEDAGVQSSEDEDSDEEIRNIYKRVGKGKGKWNEKQKPPPLFRKPDPASTTSTMQPRKQPEYGRMGEKPFPTLEDRSRRGSFGSPAPFNTYTQTPKQAASGMTRRDHKSPPGDDPEKTIFASVIRQSTQPARSLSERKSKSAQQREIQYALQEALPFNPLNPYPQQSMQAFSNLHARKNIPLSKNPLEAASFTPYGQQSKQTPSGPKNICANCLTTSYKSFSACADCEAVRYCSRTCQMADAKHHSKVCTLAAVARNEQSVRPQQLQPAFGGSADYEFASPRRESDTLGARAGEKYGSGMVGYAAVSRSKGDGYGKVTGRVGMSKFIIISDDDDDE